LPAKKLNITSATTANIAYKFLVDSQLSPHRD